MTENEQFVFIIDDDESIRKLVATVVAELGTPTEEFESAEQFLLSRPRGQRGCVVLDVRLPGMNGLQLQRALCEMGDHSPVVVITGHADVPMAVQAMRQGAASFIEKPFANAELLAAVQNALAAERSVHRTTSEKRAIESRIAELTESESAVFSLLVEGKANKEIAAALRLGVRTVESRRASIMKKMAAESLAELVRMAIAAHWKTGELG
jgi:two-component system response regulator FixJ